MPAGLRAVQRRHRRGGIRSIINVTSWWDASQETGYSDTDPVTTFHDVVGSSHLTEATHPPIFKTAIKNGLSVLRFNGTDQLIGASITLPAAGWTLTAAMSWTTVPAAIEVAVSGGASTRKFMWHNTDKKLDVSNSTVEIIGNVWTATDWHIVSFVYGSAGTSYLRVDGSQVGTSSGSVTAAASIILGAQSSGIRHCAMDFGTLVYCNTPQMLTNLHVAEQLVGGHWGITVA